MDIGKPKRIIEVTPQREPALPKRNPAPRRKTAPTSPERTPKKVPSRGDRRVALL